MLWVFGVIACKENSVSSASLCSLRFQLGVRLMAFEFGSVLERRKTEGLYRSRRVTEGPQGPELIVDGRRMLAFCSNDYLGLAADPRLAEAMNRGVARYGVGSGAAHLISGHSKAHHELEEELAPHLFFRVNRKCFVNINAIKDMISYTNSRLQIKLNHYNEMDIIVARERVKAFKSWLEQP